MTKREWNFRMKKPFLIFDSVFINCRFNSLINMLNAFYVDNGILLYNYIPVYLFKEKYNTYKPENVTTKPIKEILKENNIDEKSIGYSLNLVNEIKNCANENCCCIIRVDCFEVPYMEKFFHKKHYRRYILLYDIDLKKGIVRISDAQKVENTKLMDVPIREVEKWYKAYLDNFYFKKIDKDDTIYEFINLNNDLDVEPRNNRKELIESIKIRKKDLSKNVKTLTGIYKGIEKYTLEQLQITFNKILLSKKADLYRYEIFENDDILQLIKQQIDYISVIFYNIAKKDITNLKNKIQDFTVLEEKINLQLDNVK